MNAPNETLKTERIKRLPWVISTTGLKRTTLWRKEKEGTFPKRIKLSENAVGWKESEILSWIDSLQTVEE
tara:strand:- start:6804 stop:7013 length:210 start_codon:yes stop_codon:yes gene_type:complete